MNYNSHRMRDEDKFALPRATSLPLIVALLG
jgi:hypothetical protein